MRRLGLDIGTNSIGWCLIEDDSKIIDIGARIFSTSPAGAGRDPKSGASLAADRRDARAMRRRRDRYLGRRSAFLNTLIAHRLMPADTDEAKLVAGHDPYDLRKRALAERLEPYEIGRALFHLNQRRGFKSNRKADRKAKPGEEGKIASGAKALDHAMAEAGADTLGAFLADREVRRVRLNSENQEYDFYPQRRHIAWEFRRIWEVQAQYHSALMTQSQLNWEQLDAKVMKRDVSWRPEEARDALYRILFFQRSLKEQEVGYCTFAGLAGVPEDERRLPKAHPLFQQRRLYEEVNQLEIVSAGAADRKLTLDERDALILKLQDKKKVSFSSLARVIKLQEGERFNKESENRKDLLGDEIRAELSDRKRFGTRWLHFSLEEQLHIIDRLQNEENPETLLNWLKADYGLDDAAAEAVANANLPEGYSRFGETATRRLLDALKADVVTYDKAAQAAGFHHSVHRTGEVLDRLPYYGEILTREIAPGKKEYGDPDERRYGKITNPTVHIGLRQLQKLVNAIIAVHGRPDQIVVELARELKLNDKEKDAHKKRIRDDMIAAQKRSRLLLGLDADGNQVGERIAGDTGANRALLKLWEELNPANPLDRRCPYCGDPIGIHQLFSGAADIDHIIPYSRSLDDSAGNKVIAHRNCNRRKGNQTPHERWGHDEDRWDMISTQVARLRKSKQWRFGPGAMERVERDGGFLARQLTDTQYLSRIAGKYLRRLYPSSEDGRVDVIPGRMTAMLRRLWGLNSLLPDHNYVKNEHSNAPKNRLDHRHHAIDAAVAAVTTLGLMQQIARSAGRAEDKDLDRLFEDLPQPWEGFREELSERLRHVTVSHKPDHGRKGRPSKHRDVTAGRLHNDTAYGLTGETNAKGDALVTWRIPLSAIQPKDLVDVDRIPDRALREALAKATNGLSSKEFEKALVTFSRRDGPFKGIRRIRVRRALNIIPIRDRSGRVYKGYQGDSNAIYNVWRMPDGKWITHWLDHEGNTISSIISTFEYHQKDFVEPRPHPAAKKILSLHQNDLIAVERGGAPREIMRVQKYGQNGQIFLIAHQETGNMVERNGNSNDPFKFYGPGASALQKMKARQVRIDPLGRVFDPGPRE